MIASQVQVGQKIVIPSFGRTKNGIVVLKIKPGRYKSYLRFIYDIGSVEVPREEKVVLL